MYGSWIGGDGSNVMKSGRNLRDDGNTGWNGDDDEAVQRSHLLKGKGKGQRQCVVSDGRERCLCVPLLCPSPTRIQAPTRALSRAPFLTYLP